MGGFLGIGNSSAKTDRGNQLAGVNANWNVYNRGLPISDERLDTGKATTETGLSTLDKAKKFWQQLTTGLNPQISKPAVMQEAAPAIDAVTAQSDAARLEQSNTGTNRGGGVAEANQQAQTVRMQETDKAIRDATTKLEDRQISEGVAGAKGLEDIGTTESDIGMKEIAQAMQALGLSAATSQELIDSSIKSRPVSMQANAEVRQQWSNALAALGL